MCDVSQQSNEEEHRPLASLLVDSIERPLPMRHMHAHNVCQVLDDSIISNYKYFVSFHKSTRPTKILTPRISQFMVLHKTPIRYQSPIVLIACSLPPSPHTHTGYIGVAFCHVHVKGGILALFQLEEGQPGNHAG